MSGPGQAAMILQRAISRLSHLLCLRMGLPKVMTEARDQGACHYISFTLKHKFIPHLQTIQLIKLYSEDEACVISDYHHPGRGTAHTDSLFVITVIWRQIFCCITSVSWEHFYTSSKIAINNIDRVASYLS